MKLTEAQETFSKAQVIAKAAIGGNVTALGFLRWALLATAIARGMSCTLDTISILLHHYGLTCAPAVRTGRALASY